MQEKHFSADLVSSSSDSPGDDLSGSAKQAKKDAKSARRDLRGFVKEMRITSEGIPLELKLQRNLNQEHHMEQVELPHIPSLGESQRTCRASERIFRVSKQNNHQQQEDELPVVHGFFEDASLGLGTNKPQLAQNLKIVTSSSSESSPEKAQFINDLNIPSLPMVSTTDLLVPSQAYQPPAVHSVVDHSIHDSDHDHDPYFLKDPEKEDYGHLETDSVHADISESRPLPELPDLPELTPDDQPVKHVKVLYHPPSHPMRQSETERPNKKGKAGKVLVSTSKKVSWLATPDGAENDSGGTTCLDDSPDSDHHSFVRLSTLQAPKNKCFDQVDHFYDSPKQKCDTQEFSHFSDFTMDPSSSQLGGPGSAVPDPSSESESDDTPINQQLQRRHSSLLIMRSNHESDMESASSPEFTFGPIISQNMVRTSEQGRAPLHSSTNITEESQSTLSQETCLDESQTDVPAPPDEMIGESNTESQQEPSQGGEYNQLTTSMRMGEIYENFPKPKDPSSVLPRAPAAAGTIMLNSSMSRICQPPRSMKKTCVPSVYKRSKTLGTLSSETNNNGHQILVAAGAPSQAIRCRRSLLDKPMAKTDSSGLNESTSNKRSTTTTISSTKATLDSTHHQRASEITLPTDTKSTVVTTKPMDSAYGTHDPSTAAGDLIPSDIGIELKTVASDNMDSDDVDQKTSPTIGTPMKELKGKAAVWNTVKIGSIRRFQPLKPSLTTISKPDESLVPVKRVSITIPRFQSPKVQVPESKQQQKQGQKLPSGPESKTYQQENPQSSSKVNYTSAKRDKCGFESNSSSQDTKKKRQIMAVKPRKKIRGLMKKSSEWLAPLKMLRFRERNLHRGLHQILYSSTPSEGQLCPKDFSHMCHQWKDIKYVSCPNMMIDQEDTCVIHEAKSNKVSQLIQMWEASKDEPNLISREIPKESRKFPDMEIINTSGHSIDHLQETVASQDAFSVTESKQEFNPIKECFAASISPSSREDPLDDTNSWDAPPEHVSSSIQEMETMDNSLDSFKESSSALQVQETVSQITEDLDDAFQQHVEPIPEASQKHVEPIPEASQRHLEPIPEASQKHLEPIPEAFQQHVEPIPEDTQSGSAVQLFTQYSAFNQALHQSSANCAPLDPELTATTSVQQAQMSDIVQEDQLEALLSTPVEKDKNLGLRSAWTKAGSCPNVATPALCPPAEQPPKRSSEEIPQETHLDEEPGADVSEYVPGSSGSIIVTSRDHCETVLSNSFYSTPGTSSMLLDQNPDNRIITTDVSSHLDDESSTTQSSITQHKTTQRPDTPAKHCTRPLYKNAVNLVIQTIMPHQKAVFTQQPDLASKRVKEQQNILGSLNIAESAQNEPAEKPCHRKKLHQRPKKHHHNNFLESHQVVQLRQMAEHALHKAQVLTETRKKFLSMASNSQARASQASAVLLGKFVHVPRNNNKSNMIHTIKKKQNHHHHHQGQNPTPRTILPHKPQVSWPPLGLHNLMKDIPSVDLVDFASGLYQTLRCYTTTTKPSPAAAFKKTCCLPGTVSMNCSCQTKTCSTRVTETEHIHTLQDTAGDVFEMHSQVKKCDSDICAALKSSLAYREMVHNLVGDCADDGNLRN
ncbi:unnamed protein product [Notodromas monacha]|uniref:Uncharacterized protein n=1 Tax=Notodromas monacha TaxID=399045 RepID=A0A7R9BHP7_9CRUS|nr:unnamed protein product [Notodromas monacha]CAG0915693.1 unnamed protein product [Notodromas monacha]